MIWFKKFKGAQINYLKTKKQEQNHDKIHRKISAQKLSPNH
jgi:hypothetical protein